MGFLQEKCNFGFYTQQKADQSKPFHCGDDDLDEFFRCDAFLQSDELLCKNYCFTLDEDPAAIVAAFTLSNDSIKKIPGSRKKKVEKNIPREKLYSSYPAVKIGRLAVSLSCKQGGIGTRLIAGIKQMLTLQQSQSACRFLTVDAYRAAVPFYEKNGFKMLVNDISEDAYTVPMYYDLKQLVK